MAGSTQQKLSKSALPSHNRERVNPCREVPIAFELYGDSTVRAGADGLGIRLQLGPYQLLFDCGVATARALLADAQEQHQLSNDGLDGEADFADSADFTDRILKPGAEPAPIQLEPAVNFVFCSHAHGDHAHGLLALHGAWPRLPIFASQATSHLLSLNWPGLNVSDFCQGLPWGEPQVLMDDLSVTLFPAGHLPGAALIVVTYSPMPLLPGEPLAKPIRVAYLGDGALSPTRCTPGLDLDALRGLKPDLLITEGSYGTDRYPRRRQQENDFVEQLLQALDQGRLVLMPAPSLGIAQEVIVLLRSHHLCTGQEFDIWVDEPIAQGCDRYLDLLDEMPVATQNFARNQSLFWDDRVRPYVRRLAAPPLDLADDDAAVRPGLFLVHFESNWGQFLGGEGLAWELWLDRTDKLSSNASGWATHRAFTNQSPESLQILAASLQTGELHLNSYQLTDHCDGLGTTQFIHNLRPQHLLLVHGGSPDALQQLSRLEELRSRYQVHVAEPRVETSIWVNESRFQSSIPEQSYGGELQEDGEGIALKLANEIAQDPRWQALAETGLLEVEWQGDGLLIRGVSPQQLMEQSNLTGRKNRRPTDCCKACCFYRNQYCRNPESPLESMRVLAESYCKEFQRLGLNP